MLSRLPPPLHRALLRLAQPIRLRVWGLLRREVRGCGVLAFDPAGRVLLVRHSYHQPERWLLPGGGLTRGEDPVDTAARELLEETGCPLTAGVWFSADLRRMPGGWINRIELVAGQTRGEPRADGREIAAAAFFAPDALPPQTGAVVHVALELWHRKQTQCGASER
ncbi:NUDIX hydrolase [Novosphingobium fuchskuhlense]|uniref:NUDIX hydrolase n=1 Tax=Novosphingobium fuchskuhlense TaxID=1117702 RepID=UPI0009E77A05|nr:NUDIX domain-containing protein [Novosphingobium fuchskuhlense]